MPDGKSRAGAYLPVLQLHKTFLDVLGALLHIVLQTFGFTPDSVFYILILFLAGLQQIGEIDGKLADAFDHFFSGLGTFVRRDQQTYDGAGGGSPQYPQYEFPRCIHRFQFFRRIKKSMPLSAGTHCRRLCTNVYSGGAIFTTFNIINFMCNVFI